MELNLEQRSLEAICFFKKDLTPDDLILIEDYGDDGMMFSTSDGEEYFVDSESRFEEYNSEESECIDVLGRHDGLVVYVAVGDEE